MSCDELKKALLAYVDGELDASAVLTVESHLVSCAACTEQVALGRAMKRALRASAQSEAAPASLRARLARSTAAIQASAEVIPFDSTGEASRRPRMAPSWRSAVPWAAAAAIAIAIGGGVRALGERDTGVSNATARANATPASFRASAGHIPILDDFAEHHARPLPPEEIDPIRISSVFSPIVGVPVRPIRFAAPRGGSYRFAGARMMTVHDEAAATLFYDMGGTRVTVFVFDPQRISIRSSCCLSPKVVKVHDEDRTIYVGRAKGYSLAVQERDGVGYAVSADLGEQDVMALAASLPSP